MNDKDIMRLSPLFRDMSDVGLSRALHYFDAQESKYRRGQYLRHAGEPMRRFGFVLSGSLQIYMDDVNGGHIMMNQVGPGGSFGESLHFMGVEESPIYIMASEDVRMLWLDAELIKKAPRTTETLNLALRFVALLARRTLEMNDRIQILTRPTIRDKLVIYFAQCSARYNSRTFTITFNRNELADYLGTDRSALSRELSRMKKDGLIDYHRNSFIVKV